MDDKDKPAQQEPVADSYVQTVPDKCDRIVWRGSYYHLPLKQPAQRKPLTDEQLELFMNDYEDKPEPADDQLLWIVMAFIAFMLTLLTIRSCT